MLWEPRPFTQSSVRGCNKAFYCWQGNNYLRVWCANSWALYKWAVHMSRVFFSLYQELSPGPLYLSSSIAPHRCPQALETRPFLTPCPTSVTQKCTHVHKQKSNPTFPFSLWHQHVQMFRPETSKVPFKSFLPLPQSSHHLVIKSHYTYSWLSAIIS